jgi:hypothetical protein
MLDVITHTNSNNETLDFTSLGIFVNYNDLRNFEWGVKSKNGKITGFSKGIVNKTIPFVFLVDQQKANEIKNQFYEHFEIDILKEEKGYFEINGYKYYCYAIKSTKSKYLIDKRLLYLDVGITTDDSDWIKETTYTADFSSSTAKTVTKYPFTYPFTYSAPKSVNIINDFFTDSHAVIRIYGRCTNPIVNINDNTYQLYVDLNAEEYAEIDTFKSTITKYSSNGVQSNIFNSRNKSYDTFKKIPQGSFDVTAAGAKKVDIVLIERRSEPKWA